MLIPKRKAIFIHIPKVAGQSIEHFFLNDMDVLKKDALKYHIGPNPDDSKGPPKLAHLTADELLSLNYLDKETFDSYFKFAFVRNPWSRTISFYKFLGFQDFISFDDFIFKYFSTKVWNSYRYWFVKPQFEYLANRDGELLVDFVGKFEQLEEDFQKVLGALNMESAKLPFINKSKAGIHKKYYTLKRYPELMFRIFSKPDKHKSYQSYYSTASKEKVAELYSDDIEQFNYQFD